jgi:hypothetical protein
MFFIYLFIIHNVSRLLVNIALYGKDDEKDDVFWCVFYCPVFSQRLIDIHWHVKESLSVITDFWYFMKFEEKFERKPVKTHEDFLLFSYLKGFALSSSFRFNWALLWIIVRSYHLCEINMICKHTKGLYELYPHNFRLSSSLVFLFECKGLFWIPILQKVPSGQNNIHP